MYETVAVATATVSPTDVARSGGVAPHLTRILFVHGSRLAFEKRFEKASENLSDKLSESRQTGRVSSRRMGGSTVSAAI